MGHQYNDAAEDAAQTTRSENSRRATSYWHLASETRLRAAALERATANAETQADRRELTKAAEEATYLAGAYDERAQAHADAARRADPDDQRARDEARTTLGTLVAWAELTGRPEAAQALTAAAEALEAEDAQHNSQQ